MPPFFPFDITSFKSYFHNLAPCTAEPCCQTVTMPTFQLGIALYKVGTNQLVKTIIEVLQFCIAKELGVPFFMKATKAREGVQRKGPQDIGLLVGWVQLEATGFRLLVKNESFPRIGMKIQQLQQFYKKK